MEKIAEQGVALVDFQAYSGGKFSVGTVFY